MVEAPKPPLFPLQGTTVLQQPLPEAKFTKLEREYLSNYYIIREMVENIETWYYYPVKISKERKGNFHKLEVCPPVLREGIVCIDKNFIHVPLSDLIRRNINVTRIESTTVNTETNTTVKSKPKSASTSDKSGAGIITTDEDSKNIDLAFQNQINTLQHLEDAKEGFWEISDNS